MKKLVRKTTEANLPTKFGNFKVIAYEDYKKTPHLAIIKGNLKSYRSKASGKLKNRKFLSNFREVSENFCFPQPLNKNPISLGLWQNQLQAHQTSQ